MTDITKTFGHFLDRRTSKDLENSGFTGPQKVLHDLIFFNFRFPTEGLPIRIFLGQSDCHNKGFHWSSAVFTDQGRRTGGFRNVCHDG